jgi:hypothetical protein
MEKRAASLLNIEEKKLYVEQRRLLFEEYRAGLWTQDEFQAQLQELKPRACTPAADSESGEKSD